MPRCFRRRRRGEQPAADGRAAGRDDGATCASSRASRSWTARPTPSRSTATPRRVLVRPPARPAGHDRGHRHPPDARPRCRATCSGSTSGFSAPMSEGCAAGARAARRRRRQHHRPGPAADRARAVGRCPPAPHRPAGPGPHQARPARPPRGRVPAAARASRSGWSSATGSATRRELPPAGPARTAVPRRRRRAPPVDPGRWALAVPPAGTSEPLRVTFGRPLDHGLLTRCLQVRRPRRPSRRRPAQTGPGERSGSSFPPGLGARVAPLVVDPVLEDLAGNSVSRVFDRDLTDPEDRSRPATGT